jgi:HlyD family secretion protein
MSTHLKRLGVLAASAALVACAVGWAQARSAGRAAGRGAVDVYNPVEGRATVISSQPGGARVEKGEIVCELDPSELQDRLASEELAIRASEADVEAAKLAREVAVMALTEYKEGLFVQDLQAAAAEIMLSESNLARAEDTVDWVRTMFNKGYVSMATKVSEELALKKARLSLEQAQSKRKVLIDHTKNKTIKALLGAVETARARELRKQAVLERERSAVKNLASQIRRCKVTARVGGLVHYGAPLGAGAVVRDGQLLFRINRPPGERRPRNERGRTRP